MVLGGTILRPPTQLGGSFGPSTTSSQFSTRVSSRQSTSQPASSIHTSACTTKQVERSLNRKRGTSKRLSTILVPAAELEDPQEHDSISNVGGDASCSSSQSQTNQVGNTNSVATLPHSQSSSNLSTIVNNSSNSQITEGIPVELHHLLDPEQPIVLPESDKFNFQLLDNSRLDRLIAALGRGRATWKRALVLFQWLKTSGHVLDDRLCTTLIRVCADHGDAVSALSVYEWMRAGKDVGGAGLQPTAYTYTAAMRAALGVGMLDRAMQVWKDCTAARVAPDSRLCITYIELCTRLGLTDKAMAMYASMRDAPSGSPMRPSVHAYTAAMRAATEGGLWVKALSIWDDMRRSHCQPTGHAFAAAISACAAGQDWVRAVALFDDMTSRSNIRPDVVSCTALVTALAAAGEADKAEAVVQWMHKAGLKPNVRTYTALLTAMGNAKQWSRAIRLLFSMQQSDSSSVQPNAYSYSALIKAMGDNGHWRLAEAVFDDLETQVHDILANSSGSTLQAHQHQQHQAPLGLGSTLRRASPTAAVATDPARRMVVFQRLLTVAAAADAAQQLANNMAYSGAFQSMHPGQPVAADPVSVLQTLPLVDANSLNNNVATSSVQANGNKTRFMEQAASQPVMSMQIRNQQGVEVSSASQITTQSSGMMSAEDANTSNRNWSHPSQLNGIQLSLQSTEAQDPFAMSRIQTPSPPQVYTPTTPSTRNVSSNGGVQSHQLNDFNTDMATGNGFTPGQYSYVSPFICSPSQSEGGASSNPSSSFSSAPTTPVPGSQADNSAPGGFSLFSSQPASRHGSTNNISAEGPSAASPGAAASDSAFSNTPRNQTVHGAASAASLMGSSGSKDGKDKDSSGAQAPLINEVVCGAMMLAYERAGQWIPAIGVLPRARRMGMEPNTVMMNTAISAAGKAGRLEIAEQLFNNTRPKDSITYETIIAAYGMAGRPDKAETMFRQMQAAGFKPREFTYCGLVAAYSLTGNMDAAMAVRMRMYKDGVQPSVHVFNALLAACERCEKHEQALELLHAMKREGVEPNATTHQLMTAIGRQGVQSVEGQQVTAAAISAVFAAAGGLLMRAGMF